LLILRADRTGETVTKCDREIMEILEAYDTTGCGHSAAQLVGCDPNTVRRYVALREAGGGDPLARAAAPRPKLIDAFLPKVEELVDNSKPASGRTTYTRDPSDLGRADEAHSAQPGTAAWGGFGR
jgi:hypothetical protein